MSYYKISGEKSETARIIIIDESGWSIESNTVVSGSGAYSINTVASGTKTIIARNADGWAKGFGSVDAVFVYEAAPPEAGGDRGIFGGGYNGDYTELNTINYVTISTTANSDDFGDLTAARYSLGAASNAGNQRGVFAAGYNNVTNLNVIDYVTIDTPSNATDFGDTTVAKYDLTGVSNGTNNRGCFGGQSSSPTNVIEYITISSAANAQDFGDLTEARGNGGSCDNATGDRGVFGGGGVSNVIDYITISTTGNAQDFGDQVSPAYSRGTSNGTNNRGVFGGYSNYSNVITYITITTPSNTTDFGDLTVGRGSTGATSNAINERGVFSGGEMNSNPWMANVIDYITINSIGNATDFGDLPIIMAAHAGISNA